MPFHLMASSAKVVDQKWLRGSSVTWDKVSRTGKKINFDTNDWELAEELDIGKPSDRTYPSGISRFEAIVIFLHGGYDGTSGSMCDLQIDSDLFRSYAVILFTNIVFARCLKNGQLEFSELLRVAFGQNNLPIALEEVPRIHRDVYTLRSR